jgi:hypothetical protein
MGREGGVGRDWRQHRAERSLAATDAAAIAPIHRHTRTAGDNPTSPDKANSFARRSCCESWVKIAADGGRVGQTRGSRKATGVDGLIGTSNGAMMRRGAAVRWKYSHFGKEAGRDVLPCDVYPESHCGRDGRDG